MCLCVCRACCIRICSIMTQITSAHCLLRAAQVDITTRRVYVICCYCYCGCFCFYFFFILSYFLCFCLFREKTPALMAAKLVRISFHVNPQGVYEKNKTCSPPCRTHTHTNPQPSTHTSHAISSMIFTPKCGYQKINHIFPATKTLANLFFCACLTEWSVNK